MSAALLLALVLSADPSSGGQLTEPAVTKVRYACRHGDGYAPIVRNVEAPVYVTRVMTGERVTYEVYEVQAGRHVFLASCDRIVTTPQ